MIAPNYPTVISRLRLISAAPDGLIARLRLESILGGTQLRPAGLPPGAILVVRHLRDPHPGALDLKHPTARPPAVWQRAVIGTLEEAMRTAARPAHAPVPAAATAVVFADQAEWLACLARDWCAGVIYTRWWWQGVLRSGDIKAAVQDAWLEAPACVPAALNHLAATGDVVRFARTWPAAEARRLLARVVTIFALPDLDAALDSLWPGHAIEDWGVDSEPAATVTRHDASTHSRYPSPVMLPPPPWQAWAPESETGGLSLAQRCLLGVGLTLGRALQMARTGSFAAAVRDWHSSQPPQPAAPLLAVTASGVPGHRLRLGTPSTVDTDGHTMPALPDLDRDVTPADDQLSIASTPSNAAHGFERGVLPSSTLELKGDAANPKTVIGDEPAPPGIAQPSLEQAEEHSATPFLDVTTGLGASLTTEFGGLFYLINLAQALGLYGDFTMPRNPGIPLPIWDYLALLGQQLVGDRLHADPLWTLLAQVAGREGDDAPGQGFDPPHDWRIPPGWLAAFAEPAVWRWSVRGGRLRVEHPAPFCILDVPLPEGQPGRAVRRETATYSTGAAFRLRRGRPLGAYRTASATALDCWLGWLMPYVRARLARALALADEIQVATVLCEQAARVYVTATRVDILLSLADLPIEIRLAGLDRDPGWVPAAGRSFHFHFD